LPVVGLNVGKARFALSQRLTHVKGFFKEHITCRVVVCRF